jgi:oligopeptide/dipeptide ABC transporter ATP-binding protein
VTEVGETLLNMVDVKIYFPVRKGVFQRTIAHVKAVDGVSLALEVGDALGLVGESGSGKTTLVNGVTMLEPLTAGSITFQGCELKGLSRRQQKQIRRSMQIVFQDPFWSLNPRWLVRDIVGEPIRVHDKLRGDAYQDAVVETLGMVGMSRHDLFKYPHEFSGGMRQRIAIARALILRPRLVVLDEPTSAIDVLSQHQILLMLQDLKERLGLTFVLVSHDLSVVGFLATKIAVMYCGQVVEYGETGQVLSDPLHPYAQALLNSVPELDSEGLDSLGSLPGTVASALDPPPGCRFHPRCEKAMDICSQKEPPRVEREGGRYLHCWLLQPEGTER